MLQAASLQIEFRFAATDRGHVDDKVLVSSALHRADSVLLQVENFDKPLGTFVVSAELLGPKPLCKGRVVDRNFWLPLNQLYPYALVSCCMVLQISLMCTNALFVSELSQLQPSGAVPAKDRSRQQAPPRVLLEGCFHRLLPRF